MSMSKLKYCAWLSISLLACITMITRSYSLYFTVIFVFVLLPIIEQFFASDEYNFTEAEEIQVKQDLFYDIMLYLTVPVQFFTLFLFLYVLKYEALQRYEFVGLILTMGISCGVLGINAAHELGHRRRQYEQWMAKFLLMTSMYMHFIIEHNLGHHKNVATNDDPASANYGEIFYIYWFRTVFGGYISAWTIENKRIEKTYGHFFHWNNEMIQFTIIQIIFLVLLFVIFGLKALFGFILAAIIGFSLLELVNYIEHYGLRRKINAKGRYEKVLPVHSWNSNHVLGRIFLFELTRHSDHHANASRKYQILRHFDESPQMPFGYPAMMVLSLFPPIFFYIMHSEIEKYKAKNISLG
jgi:alkane 1-monooxygenase